MCESIKPLAVATAKGGNFPSLSFLPVSRHCNDPLPSVTVSSSDDHLSSCDDRLSSHSYNSAGSTLNERSHSLPGTDDNPTVARPRVQHAYSTPTTVTENSRASIISHDDDDDDDFVTTDVFMATSGDSAQGNPTSQSTTTCGRKEGNGDLEPAITTDSPSLNNDQQRLTDVESSVNEEAAYFVLEKPSKLTTNGGAGDKIPVSTPAYEEIDEAVVQVMERPHSPLPYEVPSVSRQESCDAYYSNIGSPDTSGYTLLSQWTRCKPEDDYTQLDPSTIITGANENTRYPLLNCSVHLGKREVLEPLSEKVCLSIKEIVRDIHSYLG